MQKAKITRIFGAMTQSNGAIQISALVVRPGEETFMGTTDGDQVLANIVVSNLDTKFEEAFLTQNPEDSTRWNAKVEGDLPTPIDAQFRSFVAHKEKDNVYWAVPA